VVAESQVSQIKLAVPAKLRRDSTDTVYFLRHFAALGALIILDLAGLEFSIQQLVHQPVKSWPDCPHQISPNSGDVLTFEKTLQTLLSNPNASLDSFQGDTRFARISNTSTYSLDDIGKPPCKLRILSLSYVLVELNIEF
jgi:hypothetical protein